MALRATAGDFVVQAVTVVMITFRYCPRMCYVIAAAQVILSKTLQSQKTREWQKKCYPFLLFHTLLSKSTSLCFIFLIS